MNKESKYNISEKAVIYAIASIVGIIVIALSLLLAASLCLAADVGDNMSSAISGICAGLGCFTAGFVSAKKIGSSGLINGGICGVIIYLLILFLSLFISKSGFSLVTVLHSAIAVISSLAGGIIGVNSAGKRRF